jgi:hypothetical protein
MTIRVTMMGPSRIGKTTLLTAVLENARGLLAGSPVTIEPADLETEERLRRNESELSADLHAGEFRAGSLRGTQDVSVYKMLISPGVAGEGLAMEFMDFPGGLLIPSVREQRREDWAEVEGFTKVSTVLLVPVDAVVLMEARRTDEKRAVPRILGTTDVRKVAERWAKERNLHRDQPATAIISPVKCESYFTDHGRRGLDRSAELLGRVKDVYGGVIETVHQEASHSRILYAPVDSLGCVELVNPRWQDSAEYGLEPDPEFLVRPPGIRRVAGAEDILVPLVQQVVAAGKQSAESVEAKARAERERAQRLAELSFWEASSRFGFWNELFARLDGVKAQRDSLAASRTAEAAEALDKLIAYDEVLTKISNRDRGRRVSAL